jgi:hypothetical protein
MPRKDNKALEDDLIRRFGEIEERYRIDGDVKLGEASPEELRELAVIDRELKELRAAQPQEASV